MMLPNSTCSTLAISIAFSRYPSTASGEVTATDSDSTTILRLVFADDAPGSVVLSSVPISNGSPVCIPDSVSVAGLFALCCPLPVAVHDADFISNLLVGFGSGSIGLSLKSCAAGAAGSGSESAAVVLSLLFFLGSPFCISSANASLITSLLQSNHCFVWSSSETYLNSYSATIYLGLRPFVVFDCVATGASSSDSEFVDVLNRIGGIGIGSTRISGLSTLHLPSVILQSTPLLFLMASLSRLL